ncbi:radical SAM protein [Sphaerisporangium rhizosphaerae]|uniref:Radical SAM protein n=1 Tax=Sphaerisporangium rhizosphaerae TaxID=2269375 RepID=A0ABW2PAT1_9ACTN
MEQGADADGVTTSDSNPLQPDERSLVRGVKVLSIMPTFRCTAACTSCGTYSSPAERTVLNPQAIRAAIAEAHRLGFGIVVFTGGEATLQRRDLLDAIAYATSLDLPTRLVTNAYWARSPQKAARVLDELMSAGLTEINYSTGDEHIRFVPIDRVAIAVVEAVKRRLPVHVMVELRAERAVTRDTVLGRPELRALSDAQRDMVKVVESPWMPLDPHQVESYPDGLATDSANISERPGCDSLLRTYTLQSDGRVAACCGLGMRAINELNVTTIDEPDFLGRAVQTAESDVLKLWIHSLGPDRVLQWAAEKDPSIQWQGMYAHHCQSCHRLYQDPKVRAVIQEHGHEMIGTVAQTLWLDEYLAPAVIDQAMPPKAGLDMTR